MKYTYILHTYAFRISLNSKLEKIRETEVWLTLYMSKIVSSSRKIAQRRAHLAREDRKNSSQVFLASVTEPHIPRPPVLPCRTGKRASFGVTAEVFNIWITRRKRLVKDGSSNHQWAITKVTTELWAQSFFRKSCQKWNTSRSPRSFFFSENVVFLPFFS